MPLNIENALNDLVNLNGFIAAALVDARSSTIFTTKKSPEHADFDIELSAKAESRAMNEKLNSIYELGLGSGLESVQIELANQYHLICPLPNVPSIFIYCILDRSKANFMRARELMASIAPQINMQNIHL
ncbi:MAG: hypothetical protein ACRCWR_08285 [Saezia sp.]